MVWKPIERTRISRRRVLIAGLSMWLVSGCKLLTREKPDELDIANAKLKETLADPDRLRLINEVARVSGATPRRFESLGLITNLPGTGGVVKPSPQREMMLQEIRRNDILDAQRVLDAPTTATAKISLIANPCDDKGDMADVLVECSAECEATDLREGHLMESHLFEYFSLSDSQLRKSHERATAKGDLLVYPASYSKTNQINPLQGVILSGGKIKDESRMAILVSKDYRHVHWIKAMESAINRRFYYQDAGKQVTVAKGKNDREIRIASLPKYRLDPTHYLGTILLLGFAETEKQVSERLVFCRQMLGDPQLARRAAWELEAIGNSEAIDALKVALANENEQVRFYAAHSLAYMDQPESVPVLESLARTSPQYRAHCLIGLSINEHPSARESLESLLQDPEAEVRFGAYWYLHHRDARNPMIAGEPIGEAFRLVRIPSDHAQVCVSMERRSEVILFGSNPKLSLTKTLEPTPYLRITPMPSGLIRVAKRTLSGEVLQTIITADFVSLVKAMLAVEGNYGDIVHTLDAIEQTGGCSAPIALHPLPRSGRLYGQKTEIDAQPAESPDTETEGSSSEDSDSQEKVGSGVDATESVIKSYSTSKTPWYRRMPFTKSSD